MRILYIDVDSLRPDRLGCYGYSRKTSPNIDRIAEHGIMLKGLYASDVPCLPSRTAFFGGRFGTKTGVINHGGVCADLPAEGAYRDFTRQHADRSLGSRLTNAGYHTCSISPFPRRHSAYQMMWGFKEFFDTGKGGLENADEIFAPAEDWLERHGRKENWFLHVNFWDPHTPYDTPEAFGNPFKDQPLDEWITQELIDEQRASYGPHSAREVPGISSELPKAWRIGSGEIKNLEDVKTLQDGYDTGVLYVDRYIGYLCEKLSDLGVLNETAILVSADHGENLGELNVWGDHQTADEFTCHIPAVLSWPGMAGGKSTTGLAYHLDLAATLAELAGCNPAEGDGVSFAANLLAGSPTLPREELYLSQGAWSLQRSLRWDRWILIDTVHTGQKHFPPKLFFDLAADPHETQNLADRKPDVVSEAQMKIDDWFKAASSSCPLGDPFQVVLGEGGPYHAREGSADWETYLQRLDATGRSSHADYLRAKGGKPRS